jgi:glycosyltransferase involved in cell wall biosynthesis
MLGKKSHAETLAFMKKYDGWGIAPYVPNSWAYYCSPLKVVEYIACGIPVLMSNVPEIAGEVNKNNLGIVYDDLNTEVTRIKKQLDAFSTKHFRVEAKEFYKRYNSAMLYKKLLEKLFSNLPSKVAKTNEKAESVHT